LDNEENETPLAADFGFIVLEILTEIGFLFREHLPQRYWNRKWSVIFKKDAIE
jgi:hypothetical protein